MRFPTLLAAAACITMTVAAAAQPLGTAITYQGELRTSGQPATGQADVRFTLFDGETLGSAVGPVIDRPGVTLVLGRFVQELDFGAGAFGPDARWLQIEARYPAGAGSYVTLQPRQRVTPAPAALFAGSAVTAETANSAQSAATASNAAQLNGQSAAFYQNASNLITGTLPSGALGGLYTGAVTLSNSGNVFQGGGSGLTGLNATHITSGVLNTARLSVPFSLSGADASFIIRGENTFTGVSGAGVLGVHTGATGFTYGVRGEVSSTLGRGVYGLSTAVTGATYGVLGLASSTAGRGVVGQADAATGTSATGVRGVATGATGITYGGRFDSASTSGIGVYGAASAATGTTYGGRFESDSASGTGVRGAAMSASGATYGGRFINASTAGIGVLGEATALTGVTDALRGENDSNAGRGVFARTSSATGATTGVWGEAASTTGRGVFGSATSVTGTNYGGRFQSASSSGTGVYGEATSASGSPSGGRFVSAGTSGAGVYGLATHATGFSYGVRGEADSSQGVGVYGHGDTGGAFETSATGGEALRGRATATSGFAAGVYGESNSPNGTGVYGRVFSSSGTTKGGEFVVSSDAGTGVRGEATSGDGATYGGYFRNFSDDGTGVFGWTSSITGQTYGVFGSAFSASGYGVYSSGDFGASGTKAFRIDHPDDPANKYLQHFAAESPEVINFYSGKATLDGSGGAVIELPAYFAKINTDPRYTLTPVGAAMPLLHVAEEIDEGSLTAGAACGPGEPAPLCSFRVAGGAPGARVSWRVEALRNDLRLRAAPPRVEIEKSGRERGTYQHPELYGQPPELGLHHAAGGERPVRELSSTPPPAGR